MRRMDSYSVLMCLLSGIVGAIAYAVMAWLSGG